MEPAMTPFELMNKEINYNCTECPSLIEIKSLSEKDNTIRFICLNNSEEKTFTIKEYLTRMQKFKNDNNMKEKCDKHEDELYRYYCLDCKTNFCDKCMKTRIHKRHKKENIYDWYPNEED